MKTYIVEETVSVTYFHKVWAENMEQAKEKFFDDFDVEYSFRDPYYGDDTSYEFFDEEEWEGQVIA